MRYYLHVLNYENGSYINIRLSKEECKKYEMYDDYEDFIRYEGLEKKYGFSLKNSHIMFTKSNVIIYKL